MTATQQPPAGLVPVWLENLAALGWRVLAIAGFVIVLGYMASLIWNVVAAIALAGIVAVVMAPLVLRLRDRGRSRTAAAGIAWVVAIGAVVGLFALLVLALLPYISDLLGHVRAGQTDLDTLVNDLALPAWLNDLVQQAIAAADDMGSSAIENIVGSVANLAGILIIGTFLLFFFLRDGDKAWLWLFQSLDESKRELITSTGDDALARVGGYVRGISITSAIAAATSFAFMLLLGTPLALPLAILTFVLGFVPYFGGVIAALVVILVTLGAVDATAAAIMAVLIAARWLVLRTLVEPRFRAETLTVHPVIILIVLPIGLHLGGLVGLILAVPIAALSLSAGQAAAAILAPQTPADLPEIVPAWLDRAAQWSWRAIVAFVFVAMLGFILISLPLVVLPVILALILAATVIPLVHLLIARGQSRGVASAVAVGGSTIAIVGVLALSLVSVVNHAGEIGDTAVDGAQAIDEAAGGHLGIGSDAVRAGADAGVSAIGGMSSELVGLTVAVILAVLLTFYFLRDGAGLWGTLMSHLPDDVAQELSAAGGRAFGVLGGYMIGTGAISFVGAASQAVIMWVLGLPLVMPIFVLSLFGGFIPYIGSLLTTGLALLIAISVGTPLDILIMLIWTGVFNIVQGNIVAPMVYSRTTAIHPAIVLAAIPAGSAVAGILGMFLVVPVLGVVATTWRSVLRIMGATEDEIPGPPQTTPASLSDEGAAAGDLASETT
jgi:predicted PurR-regulated permease PerM